jgi:hypothetical protein
MPRKGHKSRAGVGDLYDEPKEKLNLTVTPSAKDGLEEKAKLLGISKSELIERVGRGELKIDCDPEKKSNWYMIWWLGG